MAWEIRNFEPVYVDDVEEFDPYEELDAGLEKRIFGENFTDFLDEVGLNYDVNSDGDVIITDKRILEEA